VQDKEARFWRDSNVPIEPRHRRRQDLITSSSILVFTSARKVATPTLVVGFGFDGASLKAVSTWARIDSASANARAYESAI
jgi:hypothetical protein